MTVWPWTVDVIEDWIDRGLPRFGGDPINDIFPTGPGGLVSESHLLGRFRGLVDELGFPPGLDLHSFRRSYATQLITGEGFDVTFAQLQLGHEHAATTSIYTLPPSPPDYQRLSLERAHARTLEAAQSPTSMSRRTPMSRRELTYTWRVREIMARRRIFTAKDLAPPLLHERGITLTPNAIWRIVAGEPERISLKMLVALCDALDVEMNDLITFTAIDAKTTRRRKVSGETTGGLADLSDYRPVRARIVDDND